MSIPTVSWIIYAALVGGLCNMKKLFLVKNP
jgi:hypothetical protein